MQVKFYVCPRCGNLIVKFVDSGVTPVCCGAPMEELVPNTVDAAGEKHLPALERISDCTLRVKVGSVAHPMTPGHHIVFICMVTENGMQVRYLDPAGEAVADFCCCKDKPVAVYEYCNLHGLWKVDYAEGQADGPKECGCGEKKSCCCSSK